MIMTKNLFRAFSMGNVQGYYKLSEIQKNIFDETYKKHLSSMCMISRMDYTEIHLRKVEGVSNLVKVYFRNGECFLYLRSYKWMKL